MDKPTLAKLMERTARRDIWNGKGRILLNEFLSDIGDPNLSPEELLQCWRETYPYFPIDQRTANVIIICFEGKEVY